MARDRTFHRAIIEGETTSPSTIQDGLEIVGGVEKATGAVATHRTHLTSQALYGALVIFQQKKKRSLQLCVNYKVLNKITVKNKCLISNTDELFN